MRDEDLQSEEIHKGNRYLLEERDAPRLELIRGVGGGLQRVAKKTLEAASAWALSLMGAAWRVLETASPWSGSQGALARVLWGLG